MQNRHHAVWVTCSEPNMQRRTRQPARTASPKTRSPRRRGLDGHTHPPTSHWHSIALRIRSSTSSPCRLSPDFNRYVRASGEKTKYRLVTVIKKLKSGDYAALVHTEDGKWYRCINEVVKECKIEGWQGNERNGETVLAMYEQLE
jgi:hypothetical protein